MIANWKEQGLPIVPIAVNVSPKRLMKTDFTQFVKDTIEEAGIEPELIELELTEQSIIQQSETTKNIITDLHHYGVSIALDDFGTGFSSLFDLINFDIQILKIDKSFIDGISINPVNESVIKSLIILSKDLGIKVVAEGVEVQEQLSFLQQQECHQIQGYIFSKPVKANQLIKLMKKEILKPVQVRRPKSIVENRRKYYRLAFQNPLCADMTIIKFKDKDTNLGYSNALIENISLGGLRFLTNINLPVQKDILLQFTTTILNESVTFIGVIVWKMEVDNLFQYGLEFQISRIDRDKLAPLFNRLSIQVNKKQFLPNSDFLQESKQQYFSVNPQN